MLSVGARPHMGRVPHDWDIATSAKPEQIQLIFDGYPQVLDGLKHGTVTVIVNKMPIEITTFRIDGRYSDGRDQFDIFHNNLEQDLARRDFTINACAYSSETMTHLGDHRTSSSK